MIFFNRHPEVISDILVFRFGSEHLAEHLHGLLRLPKLTPPLLRKRVNQA